MAIKTSSMSKLGTKAIPFSLPDVISGRTITLDQFSNREALLIMFICRHCPYVRHIQKEIAQIGIDYADRVGIVAISANDDKSYPDDAPHRLKQMAQQQCFVFPFCYDMSQEVAKAYMAACTPEFFLFNKKRELVYHGQFDGSRPGNDVPVTGCDLRAAMDAILSGTPVKTDQAPSMGCSIKWKPGKEPEYAITNGWSPLMEEKKGKE